MKKYLQFVVLLSIISFATCIKSQDSNISSQKRRLHFDEKGEFKIIQFADLHFGETDLKDLLSVSLMNYLIEMYHPNFAALTGDMVSGYAWDNTTTFYQRNWKKYTSPFGLHNLSYSIILGNHDDQANLNRTQIMDLDMTNPHSYSNKSVPGLPEGSNYYLIIYENATSNVPKAVLWFLDTHDHECEDNTNSWGCIQRIQVEWFENEITKINKQYDNLLHVAFYHIPLPEYVTLYNNYKVYGTRGESVGCPQINTGFFQTMKNNNVRAGFCGHDHNNDYGGFIEGVELVYGRKTGFGCYGPQQDKMRGARLLHLNLQGNQTPSFYHEILQADGTRKQNGEATYRYDKDEEACGSTAGLQYPDTQPKTKRRSEL
ncbi:hypothetical protein ABPG74_008213 [Tetrahymena malaccensis]